MRRGEESDGAFQLLGDARVVEIREQHDERAMLEQCPDADRGGRRIRLRSLHRELLERTAQAHHPESPRVGAQLASTRSAYTMSPMRSSWCVTTSAKRAA